MPSPLPAGTVIPKSRMQLLFQNASGTAKRSLPLGVLNGPVWQSRELLRALVARNLKMRYKRSVLGFVWALLNPLFTVAILVAVFRFVFRLAVEDYWAFLLSGYFAWIFVLHTVGACASVVRESRPSRAHGSREPLRQIARYDPEVARAEEPHDQRAKP